MNTVARAMDARVDREYNFVNYKGGTTLVRPFPISVDFEEINQEAQGDDVDPEMERLVDELNLGGQVVGLGIDRIDYTKGIPHRFKAIGRFFEKYPQYREKVVFVQAGVISRADIDAYRLLAEQIDKLLEEVNGRFAKNGWQPDLARLERLESVGKMTQLDYAEAWAWVHFLLETTVERRQLLQGYLETLRNQGTTQPLSLHIRPVHFQPDQALLGHLQAMAASRTVRR